MHQSAACDRRLTMLREHCSTFLTACLTAYVCKSLYAQDSKNIQPSQQWGWACLKFEETGYWNGPLPWPLFNDEWTSPKKFIWKRISKLLRRLAKLEHSWKNRTRIIDFKMSQVTCNSLCILKTNSNSSQTLVSGRSLPWFRYVIFISGLKPQSPEIHILKLRTKFILWGRSFSMRHLRYLKSRWIYVPKKAVPTKTSSTYY